MYECNSAAAKSAEGVSKTLGCYLRIKQGCPLSHDLSGLFIAAPQQVLMRLAGQESDMPTACVLQLTCSSCPHLRI